MFMMFCALILVSMALAAVGDNFVRAWQQKEAIQVMNKVRRHVNGKYSAEEMKGIFKEFDSDQSGYVSQREFRIALATMGIDLERKKVASLFNTIDVDKDGTLE